MVDDWLEWCVIALLWTLGLVRLSMRGTSPRHRTVTFILLCLAVSATVNQADVTVIVDRSTGVPDVSVLLKDLVVVPASMAAVRLSGMLGSAPGAPSRARRAAYLALAGTAVGMAVLFLLVPRDPAPGDFTNTTWTSPLTAGYGLLSETSMALGLGFAVPVFWRSGRRSATGPLRTGLRLLSVGMATAVGYVVGRMLFVSTHALRLHVVEGPVYIAISRTVFFAAMLMIVTGAAVPALGGARRLVTRYAALHRLRPLWNVLRAAAPEAVLGPPPTRIGELLRWHEVDLRLYRRAIEIRDIQWLLHGRVDDATVERVESAAAVTGLDATRSTALTEAALLYLALNAVAESTGTGHTPAPRGVPDLDAEARALLLTSGYLRSGRAARLVRNLRPETLAV